MADEEYDVPEYAPDQEEAPQPELTDQEKLRLELLKLQADQTSAFPKNVPPPPSFKSIAQPIPAELVSLEQPPPSKEIPVKPLAGVKPSTQKGIDPQVDAAIVKASEAVGLDPNVMRGIASIESANNPASNKNKPTQYKGLFQIGRDEWRRHGQGNIYNADDNAMAAASLMKENIDDFRRNFNRDPSPAELYMLHQQGLGFFTKGKMTNVSGNPYPGMRGPQSQQSFASGWAAELQKRIDRAKAASGPGFLPTEQISQFMSPTPEAQQNVPLTGDLSDTPERAAQTAALMTDTPIGRIQAIAQRMNDAAIRGAITSDPRTVGRPQPVTPSRETEQVPGALPYAGGIQEAPQLPIPGIPTAQDRFVRQQMTNPTVLATATQYMGAQPPAEKPFTERAMNLVKRLQTQHGLTKDASLFSLDDWGKAGAILRDLVVKGGEKVEAAADEVAKRHDLPPMSDPTNWTGENFVKLGRAANDILKAANQADSNFAAGASAGLVQQAGNYGLGIPTILAATGYGLTKNESMLNATQWLMQQQQSLNEWSKTVNRSGQAQPGGTAYNAGEIVGNIVNPYPINMLTNAVGMAAGPSIMDWMGKNLPELPDISPISTAQGAMDLTVMPGGVQWTPDGRHIIAKTPNGPVIMGNEQLKALGWMGIMSLGLVATPSLMNKAASLLPSPARVVDGTGGATIAMSRMSDLLKANTLSTTKPLVDIYNRWNASWNTNQKAGLNPFAGQAVADMLHIYTSSGQRNLISSMLELGEGNTPNLQFRVNHSVKELKDFAKANPDFESYVRLHIMRDELAANQSQTIKMAMMNKGKGSKRAPPPTTISDIADIPYTLADIRQRISDYDTVNPALRGGLDAYKENITEGRQFVSSGRYRSENPQALFDKVQYLPHTPTFSTTQTAKEIFESTRRGDSPLVALEKGLDQALSGRLEHEARWGYIDAHGPAVGPSGVNQAFTPVSDAWLKSHTVSEDSILRVRHDGNVHTFITDPMVATLLKFDTQGYTHPSAAMFRSFKQYFQAATTNVLAPYFAPTNAFRTWLQHFVAKPTWSRAVGPLALTAEIPRQLGTRLAEAWAPQVDALNQWAQGNSLGQMLGPSVDRISRALLSHAANNWYRTMEVSGAYNRNWLDNATDRRAFINKAMGRSNHPGVQALLNHALTWTQPYSNMWAGSKQVADAVARAAKATAVTAGRGFKETGRIVADAPNAAWMRKNQFAIDPVTGQQITKSKLAAEGRRLTGDPSERGHGRYMTASGYAGLPFESHNRLADVAATGIRKLGTATDIYHTVVPWSGVLVQSPAATVAAWKEDPLRFTAWFAATELMPEAIAYLWNTVLGPEYINHMMEGRSENNRMNSTYVGLPGQRPEHGIEIPNYQEAAFGRHTMRVVLDQLFGRSPFTFQEEAWDMLNTIWKTNLEPPLPSPFTALMGAQGVTTPEGLTGQAFKARDKGYRELNKPDNVVERIVRATLPSVADFVGQFEAAAATNQGNYAEKGWAGVKAGVRRMGERTAFARDILGLHPPASGSTRITEELYKRKDVINNIIKFSKRDFGRQGGIVTKGKSGGGMGVLRQIMPELMFPAGESVPSPGTPQPPPKNPIFILAMKAMDQAFQKDAPEAGGKGFGSLIQVYGMYSQAIEQMRNTTNENAGPWAEAQKKNVKMNKMLDANKIDKSDFRAVRDFYTTQRNKVAKEMLLYMKGAEQKMDQIPAIRQKLGPDKHFTLDMADPYRPGLTIDDKANAITITPNQ